MMPTVTAAHRNLEEDEMSHDKKALSLRAGWQPPL
jgi:hypothetical protein